MANSSKLLTLTAFTEWLKSKHPRTKVGLSCKDNACPLAKFLTQMTGVPYQVGIERFTPALLDSESGKVFRISGRVEYNYRNSTELPAWARTFIKLVDVAGHDHSVSVSAQRALKIIESNNLARAARHS